MKRVGKLLAAFTVGTLFLIGCAPSYTGAPVEGWVVDEATQQPLEDVIVVIHWPLERGGLHPGLRGRLFAQETVTDAAGHYTFPGWGPLRPDDGYLSGFAPFVAFFKRGYEPFARYNEYYPGAKIPEVRTSVLHGQTVRLRQFKGDLQAYARTVTFVGDLFMSSFGVCDWERFPRMTAQLVKLGDECRTRGLLCGMPDIEQFRGSDLEKCRDPDKVLRGQ